MTLRCEVGNSIHFLDPGGISDSLHTNSYVKRSLDILNARCVLNQVLLALVR